MDYNGFGEHVHVMVTDLEKVLHNVLPEKDDLSWGPNNTFRFPERGGTGALREGTANLLGRAKITLKKDVARVDPGAKKVHFRDGSEDPCKALILPPIGRLVDIVDL